MSIRFMQLKYIFLLWSLSAHFVFIHLLLHMY